MAITKTGGTWDNKKWPCYFAAVNLQHPAVSNKPLDQMLVPVNEIETPSNYTRLEGFIKDMPVFLDSGVYNLTNAHAAKHGLTMDEALTYAPDKIDGFDELFEKYCGLIRKYGTKLWGYSEIDQGGRENKIKTRARLEKLGHFPIPVYHPFNDGWDYFDYLAERYDRICFGNVVMANAEQRIRLIATAWDRRRKYPHLWIHALGLTPSALTVAFPINSCDSSTWIGPARWGQHRAFAANEVFGTLDDQFVYAYGDAKGPRGYDKAVTMCSYDTYMSSRTMRVIAQDQRDKLGADLIMPVKAKRK